MSIVIVIVIVSPISRTNQRRIQYIESIYVLYSGSDDSVYIWYTIPTPNLYQ